MQPLRPERVFLSALPPVVITGMGCVRARVTERNERSDLALTGTGEGSETVLTDRVFGLSAMILYVNQQ